MQVPPLRLATLGLVGMTEFVFRHPDWSERMRDLFTVP